MMVVYTAWYFSRCVHPNCKFCHFTHLSVISKHNKGGIVAYWQKWLGSEAFNSMRMQRYHNIKLMCCIPNLLKSNMVWFESFTKSHMALERWVFVDVLVIVGQCCSPRLIINSRTVDPFYTIFSSVNVCVLKSRLTSISLFLYRLESPSKMTTV